MRSSAVRSTVVLGLALLTAACAQAPGGEAGGGTGVPSTSPPSAARPSTEVPADGLVLLAEYTGGFATPQTLAGRTPLAAVYADGRVITDGPVAAIHPGPALPNLQVQRLDPADLDDLVGRARAAGIGASPEPDLGRPNVADAPSTRFTLVTEGGTDVLEVYALSEALGPGGGEPLPGISPDQAAARAQLQALLDSLVLPGAASTQYEPVAVAAVVSEWTAVDDGLPPPPPVAWPGPPLPGEPLDERLGVHCVAARAEAGQAVLAAARSATTATPWTSDDGTRWALLLRPLLPHETGCADLAGT